MAYEMRDSKSGHDRDPSDERTLYAGGSAGDRFQLWPFLRLRSSAKTDGSGNSENRSEIRAQNNRMQCDARC